MWLSPIVVHVVLTDEPATAWAGLNGKAPADGVPLLRHALDALAEHYRDKEAGTGLEVLARTGEGRP